VREFIYNAKAGFPVYLIAINMRTGIAIITPILTVIGMDLGLSTIELAWLAAIPVLCFSLVTPVVGWLNRLGSVDRVISLSMWLLALALMLRGTGSIFALFFFTLVMGISTAVLNVMLPAWVKVHGGSHAGVITGSYVMLMGIAAALALAVAAPLSSATRYGWQLAMLPWGVIATVAAIWWQLRLRNQDLRQLQSQQQPGWRLLLTNKRAWEVTMFFGLQSMNAYAAGTWIPTILLDRGFQLSVAGLTVAIISLIGAIAATYVPHLATTRSDQRSILWWFSIITAIGYLGLLIDSGWRLAFWVFLALLGQAATFPLSLILVVLRSGSAGEAQALSSMMQGIGYLIAATGPLLIGVLVEVSGGWTLGLTAMLGIVLLQGIAAAGAGRAGTISP
jgi:CP family cyanate transporter-like MFS transporter